MPEATPAPEKGPPPSGPLAGMDLGGLFSIGVSTDAGGSLQPGAWKPPEPAEIAGAFPGFDVEVLIGRGGMGAVYRARQTSLGRPVAIKLLPREAGRDEAFVQRFHREARLLARLQHPHIVAVHDFGMTRDGLLYLVMEFVEGRSLADVLRAGSLTVPQTLDIVRQICEALAFAHEEGVIHRDIKPANILIDKRGGVKVADFGLAKLANEPATADAPSSMHTVSGAVLGTPDYAAPEQLHPGSAVDHRADLYSLGVMLYEMLTGKIPRGVFEPPSRKCGADPRLDEVVIKAMREEPAQRYQQATEMREDVTRVGTAPIPPAPLTAAIPAPPSTHQATGSRRFALAGGVLAVLLVTAGLATSFFKKPQSSQRKAHEDRTLTESSSISITTPISREPQKSTPAPVPTAPVANSPLPPAVTTITVPQQSLDDLRDEFAATWRQRISEAVRTGQSVALVEKELAETWNRTSEKWRSSRPSTALLDDAEYKLARAVTAPPPSPGSSGPASRLSLACLTRRAGVISSSSNSGGFPLPPDALRNVLWADVACTAKLAAGLTADGKVFTWDQSVAKEILMHADWPTVALFSRGSELFGMNANGAVFSLGESQAADSLFTAYSASTSRSNRYFAAVAPDGTVLLSTGKERLPLPPIQAWRAAVTSDDRLYILTPEGRVLEGTGDFKQPRPLSIDGVVDLAVGGAHAVVLLHDGTVKMADARGVHDSPIANAVAISSAGNLAAARSTEGKVSIWSVNDENMYLTQIQNACGTLAMDPNGTVLAITRSRAHEEARRLLSMTTLELRQRALPHGEHRYVACDYAIPRDMANAIAEAHGAYLVTIGSMEENDFVGTTLRPLLRGDVMTGGFRAKPGGPWHWQNGDAWGFSNWVPGSAPLHDALILDASRRWRSADPVLPAPFILEWDS